VTLSAELPSTSAPASGTSVHALSRASVLLVGPGWLGGAIVDALLLAGANVWTMQRSPPQAVTQTDDVTGPDTPARGQRHDLVGDIQSAATDAVIMGQLPSRLDHVVLCIAPSRERGDTHESSYPAAARGALAVALATGACTLLYTSSTGVYGRTDGSVVTDDSPVEPTDVRQQALVDAERALLDSSASGADGTVPGIVVLRVAGLYGPGRDPARRFGDPAILADAGISWSNFAWRDDVASAVLHLLSDPRFHRGGHVFNCADGHPMQAREIAFALGVERSPDDTRATPESGAGTRSSRGAIRSNQRIMVDGLLAAGWRPAVPTVLHGLARLGHQLQRTDERDGNTRQAIEPVAS